MLLQLSGNFLTPRILLFNLLLKLGKCLQLLSDLARLFKFLSLQLDQLLPFLDLVEKRHRADKTALDIGLHHLRILIFVLQRLGEVGQLLGNGLLEFQLRLLKL